MRGAPARHRVTVLLAVLAALVAALVLLTGPAYGAAPEPAPEEPAAGSESASRQPAAVPGVPEAVLAWFTEEAPGAVVSRGGELTDLDAADRAATTLGLVRPVSRWSPGLVAGTDPNPPTEALGQWVAPVLVGETAHGLVVARAEAGAVVLDHVMGDLELATAVHRLAPEAPLVYDEVLDAWFTVTAGLVRPVDERARESLAGAAPVEAYQPFLAARYTDPVPRGHRPEGDPGPRPVLAVTAVLVGVLVWAWLIVWVRRPETGEAAADAPVRDAGVRR